MNVTYESSVILKELGFNLEVEGAYYPDAFHVDGKPYPIYNGAIDRNHTYYTKLKSGEYASKADYNALGAFSAPYLDEAITWLRDVKNVHITIGNSSLTNDRSGCYFPVFNYNLQGSLDSNFQPRWKFETYEQALSFGIDKMLNGISKENKFG